MFVKYFSPNCGHCVAMAADYERLFEHSQGKGYRVAEVDCTQSAELCEQAEVRGYPTLKLYATGTAFDYSG
jgi:protein disulfide-isomerase A1